MTRKIMEKECQNKNPLVSNFHTRIRENWWPRPGPDWGSNWWHFRLAEVLHSYCGSNSATPFPAEGGTVPAALLSRALFAVLGFLNFHNFVEFLSFWQPGQKEWIFDRVLTGKFTVVTARRRSCRSSRLPLVKKFGAGRGKKGRTNGIQVLPSTTQSYLFLSTSFTTNGILLMYYPQKQYQNMILPSISYLKGWGGRYSGRK